MDNFLAPGVRPDMCPKAMQLAMKLVSFFIFSWYVCNLSAVIVIRTGGGRSFSCVLMDPTLACSVVSVVEVCLVHGSSRMGVSTSLGLSLFCDMGIVSL
uniref:Uncharacterized protein n=1 Tax=Physcomitrium patens TaxID=3218 RepID=A0A2K1K5M1_PHYPA|nr:hypothetical protein PHYPA_010965 [Physcomitrium patens]